MGSSMAYLHFSQHVLRPIGGCSLMHRTEDCLHGCSRENSCPPGHSCPPHPVCLPII